MKAAVLNFYKKYNNRAMDNIAREVGKYTKPEKFWFYHPDFSFGEIGNPDLLILTGIDDYKTYILAQEAGIGEHIHEWFDNGTFTLSICGSFSLLSCLFPGYDIEEMDRTEKRWTEIRLTEKGKSSPLFKGVGDSMYAMERHFLSVIPDEENMDKVLATGNNSVQAIEYHPQAIGLQFHPEYRPGYALNALKDNGQDLKYDEMLYSGDKIFENAVNIAKK